MIGIGLKEAMRKSANQNYTQSGNSLNWLMIVAAAIAIAAIFLPGLANDYIQDRIHSAKVINEAEPEVQPQLSGTSGTITKEKYIEAFVWVARGKLEDLGINQSLKVTGADDEKIEITGTIISNQKGRYEIFKSWFADNENFPELLDEVEVLEVWGSLPGVKSVWLGEPALAYFDDGTTGRIGEEIGDGWEIVKIDQAAILLHKNGTLISMDY